VLGCFRCRFLVAVGNVKGAEVVLLEDFSPLLHLGILDLVWVLFVKEWFWWDPLGLSSFKYRVNKPDCLLGCCWSGVSVVWYWMFCCWLIQLVTMKPSWASWSRCYQLAPPCQLCRWVVCANTSNMIYYPMLSIPIWNWNLGIHSCSLDLWTQQLLQAVHDYFLVTVRSTVPMSVA